MPQCRGKKTYPKASGGACLNDCKGRYDQDFSGEMKNRLLLTKIFRKHNAKGYQRKATSIYTYRGCHMSR
jgi:hypothetical protein